MIRIASLLFLLVVVSNAFGQGEENSLKGTPFKDRIVFGGGLGLGFSNVQDFISVSPVVGYRLTERLMAGANISYRYTNYKYYRPSIKLNDYGVGPFARFTVYKNIFVQAEYEYLNYEFPTSSIGENTRKTFNSFLAGGGFIQPLGPNVGFYLMALYNFSYKNPPAGEYLPYDSPLVLRAGVNIGNFGF
ncbi:hypothetical protein [Chryseosolibacter indicus]|uniref:Outer membrane protein beta-barrel domain-containing protein n=1 Tax=Chryseosolibacter indicus TaxID=2782351 RepID=A0ABS5VKY9_9BACT|nr:hypothetical protein [Chryseosolibacter indicus]MBT1702115.1 hypothetical protein [Chryseosolibacter indicus]